MISLASPRSSHCEENSQAKNRRVEESVKVEAFFENRSLPHYGQKIKDVGRLLALTMYASLADELLAARLIKSTIHNKRGDWNGSNGSSCTNE